MGRWEDGKDGACEPRRSNDPGALGLLCHQPDDAGPHAAAGALARGLFCVIGTIRVTLWLAALVAATNMALLTAWAERAGAEDTDPALTPVTEADWAFEELERHHGTGPDPPQPASFT